MPSLAPAPAVLSAPAATFVTTSHHLAVDVLVVAPMRMIVSWKRWVVTRNVLEHRGYLSGRSGHTPRNDLVRRKTFSAPLVTASTAKDAAVERCSDGFVALDKIIHAER